MLNYHHYYLPTQRRTEIDGRGRRQPQRPCHKREYLVEDYLMHAHNV